jgi:hypothetical protein
MTPILRDWRGFPIEPAIVVGKSYKPKLLGALPQDKCRPVLDKNIDLSHGHRLCRGEFPGAEKPAKGTWEIGFHVGRQFIR